MGDTPKLVDRRPMSTATLLVFEEHYLPVLVRQTSFASPLGIPRPATASTLPS